MTGSSSSQRPPVTEAVGEVMAKDIKGPHSNVYAPESPIDFVEHPDPTTHIANLKAAERRRQTVLIAGAIAVAVVVVLVMADLF